MKKLLLLFLFRILKSESNYVLKKFRPQIIAITGSIAKSSTKEAVYAVLKEKFQEDVWKSSGNLNTKYGIPLAILGFRRSPRIWEWPYFLIIGFFKSRLMRKYPKLLVLEWAADKPNDFDNLLSYIKLKIGLITLIGPAHLEFFKNIDGILQEKSKILKYLPKDGFAILNKNDKNIEKLKRSTKAKIILFDGKDLNIAYKAAEVIGKIYKINQDKIKKALNSLKPLKGRINLIRGFRNCRIIDDTYNSNPLSCSLALDYLDKFSFKNSRKIAILGDMLELGNSSKKWHLEVLKKARKVADSIILIGDNFKLLAGKEIWYPNSYRAAKQIKNKIMPTQNDIILVKGSRKMKMEIVTNKLKK